MNKMKKKTLITCFINFKNRKFLSYIYTLFMSLGIVIQLVYRISLSPFLNVHIEHSQKSENF